LLLPYNDDAPPAITSLAGAMAIGALLVLAFFVAPGSRLRRGQLRWGCSPSRSAAGRSRSSSSYVLVAALAFALVAGVWGWAVWSAWRAVEINVEDEP
jgi:hypothetical protein